MAAPVALIDVGLVGVRGVSVALGAAVRVKRKARNQQQERRGKAGNPRGQEGHVTALNPLLQA